jgi:CRISPR-associated exonuclease Cas4
LSREFLDCDDDVVSLSEIEHYAYCSRQWALISVDRLWTDNRSTVRGSLEHERVDTPSERNERGLRNLRALPVWSDRYGLYGRADAVEVREDGTFVPVEHKSGRRMADAAALQLAGQALCLEEMFDCSVPLGVIWLSSRRRRVEIEIADPLRSAMFKVVQSIRAERYSPHLPPAKFDARCRDCSLINDCLPQLVSEPRRAATIAGMLFSPRGSGPGG